MPSGVDERTTLVRDSVVGVGKAWIRSLGLVIQLEYMYIPAVDATMRATEGLVRQIRYNPLIDYLEPDQLGAYADRSGLWK